eukprot:CAMPEP_0202689360 /NCGR_PEP_ID=MMETSP1385-20130828/4643_1 /ASSEMBLY_ACC=CAM_ASM_000861 /TAXON_ID=933848 /ORGANISM="Elphidium margaritaceum" /LENGTH=165 /DNA_ID=CAMNT_0049344481 /DNA_START=46 /DNA_END=540 /DNA_ORIENTATION=-
MPVVSHRTDFCLAHRLKWKIVPPPAVIPPKPERIIRYGAYRLKLKPFPTAGIAFGIPLIGSIILSQAFYYFVAKPHRERFREYYFSNIATDEPDSYFLRAWKAQLPVFPTTKEEYDDLSFRRDWEIFRAPPLVPYDVKGYNKKKGKNMDFEKEIFYQKAIYDLNW